MAEALKYKRVKFPAGKQRLFIENIEKEFSTNKVAKWCERSERTVRDWRREKFLIDEQSLKILCEKSNNARPKNIEVLDKYWYVNRGAKLGWKAVIDKYGEIPKNEEYRKQKWQEWWEKEGKYRQHIIFYRKNISKPKFSEQLAEFVGIMLGDGGITNKQLIITLHSKDDFEYGKFVVKLIKELFNAPVSLYKNKKYNAINYVVSRVELVDFCVNNLGLKTGNKVKQQVDVPTWVKQNFKYRLACLRGLVDTDGSVFTHRYNVHGKNYKYKKLSFNNSSEPLIIFTNKTLEELKITNRIARNNKEVRIDSIGDMKKYFRIIRSHNPKHLKRYKF